jgi:hypothetical protein
MCAPVGPARSCSEWQTRPTTEAFPFFFFFFFFFCAWRQEQSIHAWTVTARVYIVAGMKLELNKFTRHASLRPPACVIHWSRVQHERLKNGASTQNVGTLARPDACTTTAAAVFVPPAMHAAKPALSFSKKPTLYATLRLASHMRLYA